jgi:hypothetical protein
LAEATAESLFKLTLYALQTSEEVLPLSSELTRKTEQVTDASLLLTLKPLGCLPHEVEERLLCRINERGLLATRLARTL